ncbi:MAG: NYN domain-containing protein [bacterium]|nr:NYN domain-containing protein [bacterium]
MPQPRETNLALFLDFDNLALGARDARQRLDIRLLIQRILEKGKIIVKRAYADWHHHKEHMSALHEAAIDLIEVPAPRISGKNSADIRMVVDCMDLCYAKEHIDTFVICSGDSDFSPLVSKLRENNKRVIGVGMKNSSSNLLIGNCDEFIFYDDIYRQNQKQPAVSNSTVPLDKRQMFDFLVQTVQSLLQESRDVLFSSLIKDTMTRKMPHFSERALGYSTFGDVLEEARSLGLLKVERDARSGGTWVVHGLGEATTAATPIGTTPRAPATAVGAASDGAAPAAPAVTANGPGAGAGGTPAAGGRTSRRRRRSGRGSRNGSEQPGIPSGEGQTSPAADVAASTPRVEPVSGAGTAPAGSAPSGAGSAKPTSRRRSGSRTAKAPADTGAAPAQPTPKPAKEAREPAGRTRKAAAPAEAPLPAPAAKKAPRRKATPAKKAGGGGARGGTKKP